MALKNIIAIASILVAAVSCSMEDELSNMPTKGTDLADTGIAYLSFNANGQQTLTKADNSYLDGTAADVVTDCSLFILNEDNSMYSAYDGLKVENGQVKQTLGGNPFMMQVKLDKGTSKKFNVMVVANTVQTYAACADYAAVQAKLLNTDNLNKNVKVSDPVLVTVSGYATVDAAIASPTTVALVAKQITARVKLTAFDVTFKKGTDSVNVTIKNVTLMNQNIQSATKINDPANQSYTNAVWNSGASLPVLTVGTENNNFKDQTNKPSFNTFANFAPAAGNETMLRFTLVYDTPTKLQEEKEFSFIINRDPAKDPNFTNNSEHLYIKSGYEYQIKINATLTSNLITCDALICVKDWVNNTYEVVMNDINE